MRSARRRLRKALRCSALMSSASASVVARAAAKALARATMSSIVARDARGDVARDARGDVARDARGECSGGGRHRCGHLLLPFVYLVLFIGGRSTSGSPSLPHLPLSPLPPKGGGGTQAAATISPSPPPGEERAGVRWGCFAEKGTVCEQARGHRVCPLVVLPLRRRARNVGGPGAAVGPALRGAAQDGLGPARGDAGAGGDAIHRVAAAGEQARGVGDGDAARRRV